MTEALDHEGCRALADRLSEYLDGELPADLAREIEDHFEACSRCEAFLRSLARVRKLGPSLRRMEPGEDVIRRLRARMRDEAS